MINGEILIVFLDRNTKNILIFDRAWLFCSKTFKRAKVYLFEFIIIMGIIFPKVADESRRIKIAS